MITITPGNEIEFKVEDIMYFGEHRCPECNAQGTINEKNNPLSPSMMFFFFSDLNEWDKYVKYAHFLCKSNCYVPGSEPRYALSKTETPLGGIRVAKLGHAMIPFGLCSPELVQSSEVEPVYLDMQRVQQAINFLSNNADPDMLEIDYITIQILLASSGKLTPEEARDNIANWDES